MALIIKSAKRQQGGQALQPEILSQYIRVRRESAVAGVGVALPASTTGQLFRVKGGKVLVRALIGTVTTAIQATDPVTTVLAKQLTNGSVAVGTAVTIASTVDLSSLEVGGMIAVVGTGGALVKANAGALVSAAGLFSDMVIPQGEIYLNTTATKSGNVVWDLWYQPLDPGAFVEPAILTAGLLTAAI